MLQNANNEIMEAWCCEKLANLKIKDQRLSTLSEMKVRLGATAQLGSILSNKILSAPEIYECLDDSNTSTGKAQKDIAGDILSICMSNLSINGTSSPQVLDRAIMHSNPRIKGLALNIISKEFEKKGSENINLSHEILMEILDALRHEECAIGVPATNILSTVLVDHLDDPIVQEKLLAALRDSEIVKCRVYELAVNIAALSQKKLEQVEYILDAALADLDNDDILLQVSILEILVKLPNTEQGLGFFGKRQVLEYISKRVENLEVFPLDRIAVPAIMKFFGKIARVHPKKIIMEYPQMITILFKSLKWSDPCVSPATLETFVNLVSTAQGKILLERCNGPQMKEVFDDFRDHIANMPIDMKSRVLYALDEIFTIRPDDNDQSHKIMTRWLLLLSGEPTLQFLMECFRNPFPEIKVPCLCLMRTICNYEWGISALKRTAGLFEQVLLRTHEVDKEIKVAKYALVSVLADSHRFDVHTQLRMRKYIDEGPFYVETETEVATEGD